MGLNFEEKAELIKNLDEKKCGEKAVELLQEKYKTEFYPAEVRPIDIFNYDFYSVIVLPVSCPELLFEARVSLDEKEVRDTFAVRKACEDYLSKMLDRVSDLKGNVYIVLSSFLPGFEIEESEITLEELQEKFPSNSYQLKIYYSKNEDQEDDTLAFVNELLSNDEHLNGFLKFYIVDEETRKEIQAYFEAHDKEYFDFKDVIKDYSPIKTEIKKGTINITKTEWEERIDEINGR